MKSDLYGTNTYTKTFHRFPLEEELPNQVVSEVGYSSSLPILNSHTSTAMTFKCRIFVFKMIKLVMQQLTGLNDMFVFLA